MATFNLFKRLMGSEARREHDRVRAPAGTRILVVDDSPTIRAVLAKMLIQDGYTVLKTGDGESTLQIARSEPLDLIFLDIVLPRMNGFAVLRALRRDDAMSGVPIVMMSGNLQATEQFYVQRFGADDFMKKPFGRAEVFGRIRQLVESGRLPRRPLGREMDVPAADVSGMEHVPDVALPDEALQEGTAAPAGAAPAAAPDAAHNVTPMTEHDARSGGEAADAPPSGAPASDASRDAVSDRGQARFGDLHSPS